jgi:hypothetical protein
LLVLAAVAIVAIAFGKPSPVTQAGASTPASQAPTFTAIPREKIGSSCVSQLEPLVAALDSLVSSSNSETSFSDYSKKISEVKAARGRVDVTQLDPACVSLFAAAQTAIGDHVAAFSTWDFCNHNTATCTRQSIESALQEYWTRALREFAEVEASMPEGTSPVAPGPS